MKIDGLDPIQGPERLPGKPGKVSDYSFSALFDQLVSGHGAPRNAASSGQVYPGAGVPFIPPPVSGAGDFSSGMAVEGVERLLTDLDMFRNVLANSQVPVERLSTLVDELLVRKDELASMIGRIEDEDLKAVLGEALSVVIDLVDRHYSGYPA